MPGVPSGRGCEACRKQKKKCDQIIPACSRCTRLNIECVGCGQRRFKFKSVGIQRTSEPTTVKKLGPSQAATGWEIIRTTPSSEMTMATGAFCSALEVNDVRYDLSVYGAFLKDIPKRLGSSAALDASVNALTIAFTSVHSRRRSPEVYESYVKALQALRVCLNDPKEVGTANTMCAIYLIMVCQASKFGSNPDVAKLIEEQGWIGQHDDFTGHGEALSLLLYKASSDSSREWQDTFEISLLVSMSVVIIVESFCNPRVKKLGPWLRKLTDAHDTAIPIESLKLGKLSKLPEFIHHPRAHHSEMKSTYQQLLIDIPEVQRNVSRIPQQSGLTRLRAHSQAASGILFVFSLILNTILRSFETHETSLNGERDALADAAISLAEDAAQYRPLGSSSTPLVLVSAWAAVDDAAKRMKVEEILAEYQSDFSITRWMEVASWLKTYLTKDHVPLSRSLCSEAPVKHPYT